MAEMRVTDEMKQITCVLPKGRARKLQIALIEQKDIHIGNFYGGRGVGRQAKLSDRGIGEQQEREIFDIVVPESQADELFEFIFFEADMDEPHGGMIYITDVYRSSIWETPYVPKEGG